MAKTESANKTRIVRICLAVLLIAALLCSLVWTDKIETKLGWRTSEPVNDAQVTEFGKDLNVHFVDVGQGDACIVELPDDRTRLIDAGDHHTENKKALLSYIDEHIKQPNGDTIEYFDFVILTHQDRDHCGGMYDVLTAYPAKTFYRPNVYSDNDDDTFIDPETTIKTLGKNNICTTDTYDKALMAAYAGKPNGQCTRVVITDATDDSISRITPEGLSASDPNYYTFTFYAPVKKTFADANDYSPIMILEYHEKRFMLSGDAETKAEESFVETAAEKQGKYAVFTDSFTVDVFKLGHHGSRTSSSEAFIEVMTTEASRPDVIAVISCGEGNSYGHPHLEVLERLQRMGFTETNILRTDKKRVDGVLTDERATIAVSVRGVADTGQYALFVGSAAVKGVRPSESNMRWLYVVLIGCAAVIVVLIVLPEVSVSFRRGVQRGRGRRK